MRREEIALYRVLGSLNERWGQTDAVGARTASLAYIGAE